MLLPPLYPIIDFSCFAARPDPIAAIVRYAEELLNAGVKVIQLRDKSLSEPGQVNATRRFLSCARELRRVTLDRAMLIINDRVDLCLAAGADGVHLGQDDLSPVAARRIFDLAHPISRSLNTQLLQERMGHPGSSDPQKMGHPGSSDPQKMEHPEISHPSEPSGSSAQRVPHPFAGTQQSSLEIAGERVGYSKTAEGNIDTGKKLLIGFSTHNLAQVREADLLPIDYIAIGPVFATGSKANPDPVVGIEGVRQARQATGKPLVAIGGITRLNCLKVKDAGADSVALISDLLESPGKAVADFLRVLG
jgi:thiamine monophosphate synthase